MSMPSEVTIFCISRTGWPVAKMLSTPTPISKLPKKESFGSLFSMSEGCPGGILFSDEADIELAACGLCQIQGIAGRDLGVYMFIDCGKDLSVRDFHDYRISLWGWVLNRECFVVYPEKMRLSFPPPWLKAPTVGDGRGECSV